TDDSEEAREKGIECLRLVGLEEKIESLPQKYETQLLKVIEENGIELSGGQNQKIAIARALYKDGNMVILDEPTASLDALAEAEIYQNFDKLVKNKTAVYISHRLASTKFCDKIALLDGEGLKEYGSHEELMQLKGKYYQMFMTQGKYYQEGK
ncbi:MAG TPA: ABC transporter ATP-binding protein, partial [Bacilli bacterium]